MKNSNLFKRISYKIYTFLISAWQAIFDAGFERTALHIYNVAKFVRSIFTGGQIPDKRTPAIFSITTLKTYLWQLNSEQAYKKICDQEEVLVFGPRFYPGGQETKTVTRPEIYYSLLESVTVVGGCNVIICNHEVVLYEEFEKADIDRRKFESPLTPLVSKNRMILDSTNSSLVIERGISLCGMGCENLYHWLFEYVARLKILEFADPKYASWPILVNEKLRETPQLVEILELYAPGRDYIFVKHGHRVHVSRLLQLSLLLWTPFHLKRKEICEVADCIISPLAVDFIRSKLILTGTKSHSKRIFLSRENFPGRRRINEKEVLELLKLFGFEVVYTENLTFAEQMAVFQSAEIIIGVTGAALSNIVFCKPGTTIICLISARVQLGIFSNIANLLKLDLIYLAGDRDVSFENVHNPFVVDLVLLEKVLRSTIEN